MNSEIEHKKWIQARSKRQGREVSKMSHLLDIIATWTVVGCPSPRTLALDLNEFQQLQDGANVDCPVLFVGHRLTPESSVTISN